MNQCKYGCGQLSQYGLGKNNIPCCSDNVSKCPAIKKKLRVPKPASFKQWCKGTKGLVKPWNKGKTYEEVIGVEKANLAKSRISKALKGNPKNLGHASTEEKELLRQSKIRDSINQRYENGWMPKAGRCKKIDYTSPIAGVIKVDGTWELGVAQYLDKIGVKWKRNKKRFAYKYEGKERFYTPDFYIEDIDIYLEVKGFETEKDRSKWNQFPHKLLVWKKEEIKAIKNGDDILGMGGAHR